LYKYRTLSTQNGLRFAEDMLVNRQAYFAPAMSFNDPFEGQTAISFVADRQFKQDWFTKNLQKYFGMSKKTALREAKKKIANATMVEPVLETSLRKLIREAIGIFCLSEKSNNILMWSHYADGHKGICIELKPSSSTHLKFFRNSMPVLYQNRFPVIEYYNDQSSEGDQAIAAHATKDSNWAYEKEWRVFSMGGSEVQTLPEGLISGVIMGCAISDEHRHLVLEWASQTSPRISVYQSSIMAGQYSLEVRKLRLE